VSRGIALRINLSIRCELDVSGQRHAPAALASGKGTRYQSGRRLGGPQNRYGSGGEEKNPCPCRESNTSRPARIPVTILTEIPWLVF